MANNWDRQLARFHRELTLFIQTVLQQHGAQGEELGRLYLAGLGRFKLVFDERAVENLVLSVTFADGEELPIFWQSTQTSRAQPAIQEAERILTMEGI